MHGRNVGAETEYARLRWDGDSFELPGLWLSSDELHALVALYEMASRSTGAGPLNEALAPLRGRIEKLLAAESGRPGWPEGRVRVVAAAARRLDEAVFLGGLSKGPFLEAFAADIFFDDSGANTESARRFVATGHVPHGVGNP